jgi:hypothetical protein
MPLTAQLGNLGSEFSRAMKWQGQDDAIFWSEVSRFLDYINSMILQPGLPKHRQKELFRVREVATDKFLGTSLYGGSAESLQRYFDDFAILSRKY